MATKMWLRLVVVLVTTISATVAQEVAERPPPPWWKSMVMYQVFPRSFRDSDGDGSGDLRGITQMADYFKELGVDAVSLLPIYTSPMVDAGFDVSNFKDIDPLFGTMQDFDHLAAKFKELGIKLIVDFAPNHTSDEHPWFKSSVKNDPDYKDFYVWKDPRVGKNGARQPPNNWMSVFGGSAWDWSEERQQYYLHIFHKRMPDLNYRNPAVVGNMTDVLRFWLDKGVDGFRMSAEAFLYEDSRYLDAPPVPGTDGDSYLTQSHFFYTNQPETFALLRHWADLVYERVQRDKKDRVVLLEVVDDMSKDYYGTGKENLLTPFCFNLMWHVNQATRPTKYMQLIHDWMSRVPTGDVATWAVGNFDQKRIPDRYGPEMVDAINLLSGVLPGIKVTYYGEEVGMSDTFLLWEQTEDPAGTKMGPQHYLEEGGTRDPARTPMQWDNTTSAGFSSSKKTWLPVNPNYWRLNVKAQRAADNSHLKVFQAMTKARKDPVLIDGSFNVSIPNSSMLVVTRSLINSHFVLVINMGSEVSTYNSSVDTTVVAASINSGYSSGQRFQQASPTIELRPKAAVLLKTVSPTSVPSDAGRNVLSDSLAAVIITFIIFKLCF